MVNRKDDVEGLAYESTVTQCSDTKSCWACGQEVYTTYEFCPFCGHATTEIVAPSIEIVAVDGRTEQVVEVGDEVLIGKGEECDVQPRDGSVSEKHARLFRYGQVYVLEDLGTESGTFLRVTRPAVLRHGDEILVGETRLRFVQG